MKKLMKIRVNGKRDKIESCNLIDAFQSFQQRDQIPPSIKLLLKEGEMLTDALRAMIQELFLEIFLWKNDKNN